MVTAFEGFEDGKPVAGTKFDDRIVRVAKDTLAHGLDEVLLGAEVGVEVRKTRSYNVLGNRFRLSTFLPNSG